MADAKPAMKLTIPGQKLGNMSWEHESGDVTLVGDRITNKEQGVTLTVLKIDSDGIWALPKEAE